MWASCLGPPVFVQFAVTVGSAAVGCNNVPTNCICYKSNFDFFRKLK